MQSDEVLLEKVSTFFGEGLFDPALKIRDRVETQYQTKDGTNFRTKSFDYDSIGNPRDEEFHLDGSRRVGIARSFYPEGNLQEITNVDGITKRLSYDDGNLFPRLERVIRDGGASLDTTRSFSRLTGEVEDETGPHGIGWRKVTDNLGRPLEEYVRDASGAERHSRKYQYEWLHNQTVEASSSVTLLKTSIWEPQEGYPETDIGGRPFKISYSDTSGQAVLAP